MKYFLMLFLFVACEGPKDAPIDHQAQTCGKELDCINTYNWHLQMNRNYFPQKIILKVGDETILDECQGGNTIVRIQRGSASSTVEMDQFSTANDGDTFPLQIKDCLLFTTYYSQAEQGFVFKTVGGVKTVWIDIY
jgi:hypothetical protein